MYNIRFFFFIIERVFQDPIFLEFPREKQKKKRTRRVKNMNKPSKGYQSMGLLQHLGLVGWGAGGFTRGCGVAKDQKFSNTLSFLSFSNLFLQILEFFVNSGVLVK